MPTSKITISSYGITAAEYKVICALRNIPVTPESSWFHELGGMVIGEGATCDMPAYASWGTDLYFAFKELGIERGEIDK